MNKTYNQIIDTFRELADSHNQVNYCIINHPLEINDTQDKNFPLVALYPSESIINNSKMTLKFKFFVMDLLRTDKSNEDDVINDTLQIMNDFIAKLKDGEDEYGFYVDEGDINLKPFSEDFKIGEGEDIADFVAGWFAELNIVTINDLNECLSPFNVSVPAPTPPTPPSINVKYLASPSDQFTIYSINGNIVEVEDNVKLQIGETVALSDASLPNDYARNYTIIGIQSSGTLGHKNIVLDSNPTDTNCSICSYLTSANSISYGQSYDIINPDKTSHIYQMLTFNLVNTGDYIEIVGSNGEKYYDIIKSSSNGLSGTRIEPYIKIYDGVRINIVTIT